RPGGLLLFDVAGPGRGPERGHRSRFFEGDDWAIYSETSENRSEMTLRRRSVFFRRKGRLYRRGEEIHALNLHEPRAVEEDLRAVGFRVRRLRHYGDLRLPRGLHGFLAAVASCLVYRSPPVRPGARRQRALPLVPRGTARSPRPRLRARAAARRLGALRGARPPARRARTRGR